jgi:hypothetical protein
VAVVLFDPDDEDNKFFRNVGKLYHTQRHHILEECTLQSFYYIPKGRRNSDVQERCKKLMPKQEDFLRPEVKM